MANATDTEIAAARAAYFDNADYEEAASVAKAKAFITACRKLLALPITRSANGARDGNEVELQPDLLERQQSMARQWVAAYAAANDGAGVIHADFTGFRD
jgi:hypothetical protein